MLYPDLRETPTSCGLFFRTGLWLIALVATICLFIGFQIAALTDHMGRNKGALVVAEQDVIEQALLTMFRVKSYLHEILFASAA